MKKNNLIAILSIFGVVLFFAGNIKAQQQTVAYPCIGFPQFFGVPLGVTQITAEIVGSDGNVGSIDPSPTGKGAKLTTTISVTPGDVLTIYSGCTTGYGFTRGGRYNVWQQRYFDKWFRSGITGGGSSAILKDNTVVAVAGGGGTSGSSAFFVSTGGKGGDAILASGNGGNGTGLVPGSGGIFGGASTGNGADGTVNSSRLGGGGGGGGGYDPNGGGGGGGGMGAESGSGGGGGGGKSYVNPLFVNSSTLELFPGDQIESGYIKITYNGSSNGHRLERCTQAPATYTVPNQVRSLIVTAFGGDGGGLSKISTPNQNTITHYSVTTPLDAGSGLEDFVRLSGAARGYQSTIPVVPGEQLVIGVGCKGLLSTIGNPLDSANPGGPGGYGFIPGSKGGDGDKPPLLLAYGIGGVGGGGATGIGRIASFPLFIAPGGGGGGGYGSIIGCYGGEGGVGGVRNGGDSSPCANNGRGGLTGGGTTNGGNACFFCSSAGGGGGFPGGRGGTAGGIGAAGGGGGGGGLFYASPGSTNYLSIDPIEYRWVLGINNDYYYDDDGGTMVSRDGVLAITPVYTNFAPPVITPSVAPLEPNGNNGWYRTNVNISWQVTSNPPVNTQTGCQTATLSTDTAAFNSSCSATNSQGTTSGSIPTVKRDATLPNISATAVQQGGVPYIYGTTTSVPVTVTFSCNDNLSGVASCPAPQTFGSNATVSGTAIDNAGNSRTVNFGNIVSDNQPPTISPINNVETPVNTTIPSVPFTIGDAETPAAQLAVRFSSSNENVVRNELITLLNDPNPANKALEIIPVLNKVGTTIITVDVSDARSAKATTTFLVSVRCGTITIQQPGSVTYGSYLNAPLYPTGGVAPYSFIQTSGLLPTYVEFDPDFNRLVGGPVGGLAPNTRQLEYLVTDANGCSNPVPVTLDIACLINPAVTESGDSAVFSLRGMVEGACPNSTITFDSVLNNQEIAVFGAINVLKPLTIQGPGADKLTLKNVNPPGNNSNVLTTGQSDVTISGLTIKDGNGENAIGGGIRANGNLTVKDSVITNNQAQRGGGIAMLPTDKTLTVINSTVSNNISQSSIDNDAAGILSNGAVNIVNSTISGNTHFGGNNGAAGIYAPSGLISNSTITNNLVDNTFGANNMASGVYGGSTGLTIRSSIIAGNQNNGALPDVVNQFTSGGFNLIGNRGSTTAFNQPTDQTGLGGSRIDPMLDILRNNGGTTPTHSFLSMLSPAIDKGSAGSFPFAELLLPPITTDQRGIFRPYDNPNIPNANGGDGSDIGAFEIAAPSAASVDVSGRILSVNGRGISRARIVLTMPSGETRMAQSNSFGYYRFTDLEVGQTYIFEVHSKQYIFSPQVLNLTDAIENLNFTAISNQ